MEYTVEIESSYKKNSTVMSAQDIKDTYLYGVATNAPNTPEIPDESLSFWIEKATSSLEDALTIRIKKQIINEDLDFDYQSAKEWYYLKATYPINEVLRLEGSYGMGNAEARVTTVPLEYVNVRRTGSRETAPRVLHIVANTLPITWQFYFTPTTLYANQNHIPYFWKIRYCTGFDIVPDELIGYIAMMAMVDILNVLGDVLFGAGFANFSLSIDGLSQSAGTTNSATSATFGARLGQYKKILDSQLEGLKATYKGITFSII